MKMSATVTDTRAPKAAKAKRLTRDQKALAEVAAIIAAGDVEAAPVETADDYVSFADSGLDIGETDYPPPTREDDLATIATYSPSGVKGSKGQYARSMVREAKQRIKANRYAPVEVEVEAAPVETRPVMPDDCNTHEQQVAYHVSVIRWEQAHPEIVAAEEAAKDAKRKAKRDAEKAAEKIKEAAGRAMARPVEPVQPDNFDDLPDAEKRPYWAAHEEYEEAHRLWREYHEDEWQAERDAEKAARLVEDRKLLASDKKTLAALNPYALQMTRKRVKEADRIAAHHAKQAAERPKREAEQAAREAKEAAEIEAAKGAPRPVTPTVAAWFKLSEEKQEAYNDAIELWNEANPDPVYFAAQAAIKEAGEPEWHSLEEGWDAYQVRLDKWEAEHADIVAAFKAAEAAWTERDRPWQAEEAAREKAAFAAKDAKRIKREAKDPEEYKAASLEEAQADEIDNSGEEEDAKQDAREGGERWGDVKDDWRENWINDNWTPELEAAWLVEFEDKWLADHGQAFPGHGKAEPKLEPVKAEAKPVEAAAPVVEAKPVKVEPVSVTVTDTPATSLVPLDVLGKEIVACAKSGDKNLEKAEQLYKAAGLKLIEARDRTDNFKSFLKIECKGLSRARAYELIAIGDGSKTLEQVRDRAAKGMRKTRAKQADKSAKPNVQTQLFGDFKKLVKQATPETKREMLDYLVERQ
jgi:hypothetical protein